MNIFLDEVVTQREPPYRKEWETVGTPKLIIIGHYRMGFDIKEENDKSKLRVFIDYEFPSGPAHLLGWLLSGAYAKWCVRQMINGAKERFEKT